MNNANRHTLADAYGSGKFGLSFELFPPKTDAGEVALHRHVAKLVEFGPSYITCTYGAGGSTREKTLQIISQVKSQHGLPVASHLTCVGSTVDDLRNYLIEAQRAGVDYIVCPARRSAAGRVVVHTGSGRVVLCQRAGGVVCVASFPEFGIAVAGYPEKHQEAPSAEADLENLKRKADAGADAVITQLFYNNDDFLQLPRPIRRKRHHGSLGARRAAGDEPISNSTHYIAMRGETTAGIRFPVWVNTKTM